MVAISLEFPLNKLSKQWELSQTVRNHLKHSCACSGLVGTAWFRFARPAGELDSTLLLGATMIKRLLMEESTASC